MAVGMSSGFIEPLEASALVLVELAAGMIADQLPPTREIMDIVANRFNRKFLRHWNQIIDFLKLHYVLSKREDSDYWKANREDSSIPDNLREQLSLWRYRSPWHQDANAVDDLFPTASYQYILYGMGFETMPQLTGGMHDTERRRQASEIFQKNAVRSSQLKAALPGNRELLKKVREFGFQAL